MSSNLRIVLLSIAVKTCRSLSFLWVAQGGSTAKLSNKVHCVLMYLKLSYLQEWLDVFRKLLMCLCLYKYPYLCKIDVILLTAINV